MSEWDVWEKLTAAALDGAAWTVAGGGAERLHRLLQSPDFPAAGKVHDWRNHVDAAVIEVWDELPTPARLVAFIAAAKAAESEEWE